MKYIFIFLLLIGGNFCLAQSTPDAEKQKWIEDTQKQNRELLKKVDQDWVHGCLPATTVYVSKNRKINDGLSPSFNAEQICAILTDEPTVVEHLKNKKKLKFQGCLDGVGMAMQMFDKKATNQKRKEVLAEYCM